MDDLAFPEPPDPPALMVLPALMDPPDSLEPPVQFALCHLLLESQERPEKLDLRGSEYFWTKEEYDDF